jgi:hypothetical protein
MTCKTCIYCEAVRNINIDMGANADEPGKYVCRVGRGVELPRKIELDWTCEHYTEIVLLNNY